MCNEEVEKCSGDKCDGYRGLQTKTVSGRTCQAWTSMSPHVHAVTPITYPLQGLVGNYCRNPDGEPTIWCFTTDPGKRWELCDPRVCATTTVKPGSILGQFWRV